MDGVHWLRALGRKLNDDSSTLIAAGVAFFAALAVIPAMAITVSIYGIFTSPEQAKHHVDALLEVLPESSVRLLEAQIQPVADFHNFHLSIGLVISILALLWTASNATRALVRAIAIAYGQRDQRSPLERRGSSLAVTLGAITITAGAVAVIAAIPVWFEMLDPDHVILTFGNLRWALIGLMVAAGLAVLYWRAPADRPGTWREILPGVLIATALWMAISLGFAAYVGSFGRYSETYGPLAGGAILLVWMWLSTVTVIVGAQINYLRSTGSH